MKYLIPEEVASRIARPKRKKSLVKKVSFCSSLKFSKTLI